MAVATLGSIPALAQPQAPAWPSRPVKVIMATAAGSAPDVIARIVTDRLAQLWGQQILILNRPGAGGLIALQALASSERDGHTLYLPSSSSLVVLPETNSKLPLDIQRDLVPIGLVGEQPFLIVAGNTLGVNTLAELIALGKSKPGELTYAANFRGSLPNMTGEMVSHPRRHRDDLRSLSGRAAGTAGRHGRAHLGDGRRAWPSSSGRWLSNSIKPLAITSPKRLPNYPNLPTVAETVPGFNSRGWFVFLGPVRDARRRGAQDQRGPAQGARSAGGSAALRDAGDLRAPSVAGGNRRVHPRRAGGVAAGGQAGRRHHADKQKGRRRAPFVVPFALA